MQAAAWLVGWWLCCLYVTLIIMVDWLGFVWLRATGRFVVVGCIVHVGLSQQLLEIAMHEAERQAEHGVNRMNVIALSDVPLLAALTKANIKRSWLLVIISTLISCCSTCCC